MIERFFILTILTLFVIGACKKDEEKDDNSPGFNQSELLVNWGDKIIVPSYKDYRIKANLFNTLCASLPTNPSTSELKNIHSSFEDLYIAWQKISFLEFGPASDIALRAETNVYPTNYFEIENKIITKDFSFSGASDLSQKGLPAIDYLLFGPNALVGNERISYLKAISQLIYNNANIVFTEWSASENNYVEAFKSNTGNDAGSSLGIIINAMNQHLERFHRESKIGIPNGERSFSKTPIAKNVEGYFSGTESIALGVANLKALEALYLGVTTDGANGVGIEENLNTIGAKYNGGSLDDAIKSQFKSCFMAYDNISVPLKDAVTNENGKVSAVYIEIQKLTVLFKADVPAALSILITYQDSDGD